MMAQVQYSQTFAKSVEPPAVRKHFCPSLLLCLPLSLQLCQLQN